MKDFVINFLQFVGVILWVSGCLYVMLQYP